jgi:hypothetical protein
MAICRETIFEVKICLRRKICERSEELNDKKVD